MLLSPVTSSRQLTLLCTICISIVVLYGYARSPHPDPRSTHISVYPTIENAKKWHGDNRRIETVKEDGVKVFGDEITTPAESNDRNIESGNTSGWSPGIPATTSQVAETVKHSYEQIQEQIQDLRKDWTPPKPQPTHWPPYEWYFDEKYDPNRWEGFEWENGFYVNNGIKELADKAELYLPYPEYNSPAWKSEWMGDYVACEGPRGMLLNESDDDVVHAYPALPSNFPDPVVGGSKAVGIHISKCFDRYGRLGPYGYGQGEKRQVPDCNGPTVEPNWPQVCWSELQDQCLIANRHRYRPKARRPIGHPPDKDMPLDSLEPPREYNPLARTPRYHSRTALLIRTWSNYTYTENDMQSIRALITELSLLSGGEYQVYLLVHVKNATFEIWSNNEVYQEVLKASVPPEFQGISILWNQNLLQEWYSEIGNWDVYWHQFMPLQWFSKLYPDFDYIWNWEADARYTGNHYHLLEQVARFAQKAPRKYLWERNSRFYIPAAHGTYEEWVNDTDVAIEDAVRGGNMNVVWGPQPYNATIQQPIGPTPPRSLEEDSFDWGVGEEADLITLQPIWDPTYTLWTYRDKIFNYVPGIRPHFSEEDPLDDNFHHPEFVNIPRRTFINTVSRFSRKQLHAMHLENYAGRTMQAEMWPATVALQHGLKAVYAPHPIWADHRWPAWYMDAIFNADGNETARWGTRSDSAYNHDREHNFGGWSWYYDSKFARVLYRRWLGWSATMGSEEQYPNSPLRTLGGKQYEDEGFPLNIPADAPAADSTFDGREVHVGGKGRMCLPPMLLHPVKHMYEEGEAPDRRYEGFMGWLRRMFHW